MYRLLKLLLLSLERALGTCSAIAESWPPYTFLFHSEYSADLGKRRHQRNPGGGREFFLAPATWSIACLCTGVSGVESDGDTLEGLCPQLNSQSVNLRDLCSTSLVTTTPQISIQGQKPMVDPNFLGVISVFPGATIPHCRPRTGSTPAPWVALQPHLASPQGCFRCLLLTQNSVSATQPSDGCHHTFPATKSDLQLGEGSQDALSEFSVQGTSLWLSTQELPANAGGIGSIPDPGKIYMAITKPMCQNLLLQFQSPGTATTEAQAPLELVLHKKKSPGNEKPAHCNQESSCNLV